MHRGRAPGDRRPSRTRAVREGAWPGPPAPRAPCRPLARDQGSGRRQAGPDDAFQSVTDGDTTNSTRSGRTNRVMRLDSTMTFVPSATSWRRNVGRVGRRASGVRQSKARARARLKVSARLREGRRVVWSRPRAATRCRAGVAMRRNLDRCPRLSPHRARRMCSMVAVLPTAGSGRPRRQVWPAVRSRVEIRSWGGLGELIRSTAFRLSESPRRAYDGVISPGRGAPVPQRPQSYDRPSPRGCSAVRALVLGAWSSGASPGSRIRASPSSSGRRILGTIPPITASRGPASSNNTSARRSTGWSTRACRSRRSRASSGSSGCTGCWDASSGSAFAVPFAFWWVRGRLSRRLLPRLAGLFALGALQGALGWYMVASGLVDVPRVSPYRLTAHLGLAVVIFGGLVWTALDLLRPQPSPVPIPARLRHAATAVLLLVLVTSSCRVAFVAGTTGWICVQHVSADGRTLPSGRAVMRAGRSGRASSKTSSRCSSTIARWPPC